MNVEVVKMVNLVKSGGRIKDAKEMLHKYLHKPERKGHEVCAVVLHAGTNNLRGKDSRVVEHSLTEFTALVDEIVKSLPGVPVIVDEIGRAHV